MYVIYKKISRVKSGKGPSDDIGTRKSVSLNTGGPEVVNHIFRAQEPKAPVTYCDHALSGVRRPSSVVR